MLIEAAARAGVERLVWTSITNPGQDPDLSYFAGKAVVEQLVRRSGLSYAILRPACFFGGGGILIDNVAWAARRMHVQGAAGTPKGDSARRPPTRRRSTESRCGTQRGIQGKHANNPLFFNRVRAAPQ